VRVSVLLVLALGAGPWSVVSGRKGRPAAWATVETGRLLVDFDNDNIADLAVGIPGGSVGAVPAAGAVSVLYGSSDGLSGAESPLLTQNSPGVAGIAEPSDALASAMATEGASQHHCGAAAPCRRRHARPARLLHQLPQTAPRLAGLIEGMFGLAARDAQVVPTVSAGRPLEGNRRAKPGLIRRSAAQLRNNVAGTGFEPV
jgi:hypothetical protein